MDQIAWNRNYLLLKHDMIGAETNVCGVPTEVPSGAARAKWLDELSNILNEAHELLVTLNLQDDDRRSDAVEVYLRIEAARLEVQALRLSRSLQQRQEPNPDWIEFQPWSPALREGP
jgi:hypothetical protein